MIYSLDTLSAELNEGVFVAPSANLIGSVVLHAGVSIWFNAVLRGDSEPIIVGRNSNIQDGCVCHTDPGCTLKIGENVTVGHMAMLHGCTIGSGSLIGIGSSILNNARIGRSCLVGAHTLITEDKEYPDRSLIIGSPGKTVRELSDREVKDLENSASLYVRKAARYLDELRKIS